MLDDITKRIIDGAMVLTEKMSAPIDQISAALAKREGQDNIILPYKRRGEFMSFLNSASIGPGSEKKKRRAGRIITLEALTRLAATDPITWSILKARRDQISQIKWVVQRNTEDLEQELDQWSDSMKSRLNKWGLQGFQPFEPRTLPKELVRELNMQLEGIVNSPYALSEKRAMLRWLFENAVDRLRCEADERASQVQIFKRPNRERPNFNTFITTVLDDLLKYDAGVIIKNKCEDESVPVAELYVRPGQEIYVYRNEDSSVPEPPESAFLWEKGGQKMTEFNDDELIYIVANPQQDFYGMSPLEVAAYIISTTLYVDNYNIEFFKHSNVPPGVLDLGEGVTQENRAAFRAAWEAEINRTGGLHRMMFMSGSKGVQYIPLRPYSSKDMQMMEYLKWSLSIKAACFQISPQDIGFTMDLHRSTSEVQYEINKDRGLRTIIELFQAHLNEEIIKKDYGLKDVEYKALTDTQTDKLREAQQDQIDIQMGIMSRNDRRKKIGKRPIEGGDVIWIESPQGLIPIEMADDVSDQLLIQGESYQQADGGQGNDPNAQKGQQDQNQQQQVGQGEQQQQPKKALPPGKETKALKVSGYVDHVMQALQQTAFKLQKRGRDVVFKVDYTDVKLDLDKRLRKNYGFGVDNVDFPPMKDDPNFRERVSRKYGVHGQALIDAMKREISMEYGGHPDMLDAAIRDQHGNERHLTSAIPSLLGVAAVMYGGRGVLRMASTLAERVGPKGQEVITQTIGRMRPVIRRHGPIRGTRL